MTRYLKSLLLGIAVVLCCALPAQAVFLTDLDPTDMNIIQSQGIGETTGNWEVYEDYNEIYTIPYPSHDGYAIVNAQYYFFDKLVDQYEPGVPIIIDFYVHNSGPYTWSDYHFELLDPGIEFIFGDSDIFQNQLNLGNQYHFWAPGWQSYCETQLFHLEIMSQTGGPFILRQVATTTPIPAAFWLFGTGLVGLVGLRRKLRS